MDNYPQVVKVAAGVILAIATVFILIITRDFLYPLALAILFAYLLYPIANGFENRGVPRILSNFITIIFALFVVGSTVFLLSKQLSLFLDDLPTFQRQASSNIDQLEEFIEDKFGVSPADQDQWLKNSVTDFLQQGGDLMRKALSATAGTVVKFALIPVYIFFLLYYRDKYREFLLRLVPVKQHDKTQVVIREISFVTKRYMIGVVTVVAILCFINSLGLYIIGVEYALLLGIVSALFNFIPYFGTLIGGSIPLLFALVTESPQTALGVFFLFLIIQFLENNILTPNITGGQVSINPFITILSIIIGGMIWGIPGMFAAVPFLGMFKVMCDNFQRLEPYSFLIGTKGTEKHTLNLKKIRRFFERLSRN